MREEAEKRKINPLEELALMPERDIPQDDHTLLIRYLIAEVRQGDEYLRTGRWHCDCSCSDCRVLEQWHRLSWWRRLIAKLSL
mgnify:FL=1